MFLALIALALPSPSFAAVNQYLVQSQLLVDGQKVASPAMVLKEGSKAEITDASPGRKLWVQALAKESKIAGHNGEIQMEMRVAVNEGPQENVTAPKFLVKSGEEAIFRVGNTADGKPIHLKAKIVRNPGAKK